MKTSVAVLIFLTMCRCVSTETESTVEKAKHEILDTEKAFELLAEEKGIALAFAEFADEKAVLNRTDHVVKGRDSILRYYQSRNLKSVSLKWNAEFVDVAKSCDLGYTYGNYTFAKPDSLGNIVTSRGIFHTVWKKQPDGKWKFVWD